MENKILILHGALGSAKQFETIQKGLQDTLDVYLLDFDGHGNGNSTSEMSMELFAENTFNFVEKNNLQKAHVFGYSMGGYVALYLQSLHPNLFQSIITLGTKFNWSVESAEREIQMLNSDKIKEKIPAFASYLQEIQAPKNWEKMMEQTATMLIRLGSRPLLTVETLQKIQIPITLCLGDLDKMVTQEETQWAAQAINKSNLKILQGVQHPLQLIDSEILIKLLKSQLDFDSRID